MIAGVDAAEPRLAHWADVFDCYTAALATWLSVRTKAWWRPLLAGGPVLAVSEAAGGLLRLDHHARPPAETLHLVPRHGDDWRPIRKELESEAAAQGAVIVCGDTYYQPWQRGYGRWHAPHWITVVRDQRGDFIEDVLSFTTQAGLQQPLRVAVTPDDLATWGRTLTGEDPVHWLRERSTIGRGDLGLGARYRWLAADGCGMAGDRPLAPGHEARLTGVTAVLALADRFQVQPLMGLRQADDLWQALRLRELLIAASQADPGLLDDASLAHWRSATELWREVPRLLAYQQLRIGAGLAADMSRPVELLTKLAAFEGLRRIADQTLLRGTE